MKLHAELLNSTVDWWIFNWRVYVGLHLANEIINACSKTLLESPTDE
jgi:hypothetical protein